MPVEGAAADETAVQAEEERILESEVTTTYSYLYAGGKLLQETVTTGDTTETHNFFYDNTGKPYAMQTGGTTYYYVTNLQGDVVALLDASGNAVASYAYDPYGKVLSAEGAMAETNPLRYRGYYYDTETGLYYLQSRYYDPTTCRFVNADNAAVIAASPEKANWDKNLFAYCDNDSVNRKDDGGELWHIIAGAVIGGLMGAVTSYASGNRGVGVLLDAVAGAAGGALAATGAGRVVQAVGSSLLSMASNVVGQIRDARSNPSQKFSVTSMLFDGAVGFAAGRIGKNGASYGNEAGIKAVTKQFNKHLKTGQKIGKAFSYTLIGMAIGIAIGYGIYYVTDMKRFNGKTLRRGAKDYANAW